MTSPRKKEEQSRRFEERMRAENRKERKTKYNSIERKGAGKKGFKINLMNETKQNKASYRTFAHRFQSDLIDSN